MEHDFQHLPTELLSPTDSLNKKYQVNPGFAYIGDSTGSQLRLLSIWCGVLRRIDSVTRKISKRVLSIAALGITKVKPDGGNSMAKVLGVGGVFFKSGNPQELAAWYKQWLGLPVDNSHSAPFKLGGMPSGAYTVWAPFDETTSYFDPSSKAYMFNLIVDDLEEALFQVEQGGAEIVGEITEYEFGRFGWFLDPEGNKVELWQPSDV
jgi:predicted enzyme related to lactoylglutathione lyase